MVDQCQGIEDVLHLVDKHGIESIFASFNELRGKSCAKLVPTACLEDLFANGAGISASRRRQRPMIAVRGRHVSN